MNLKSLLLSVIPHRLLLFLIVFSVTLYKIPLNFLLETFEEEIDVGCGLFFLLIVLGVHSDVEGGIDAHLPCQPVFVAEGGERYRRDWGVGVALLVGRVSDQTRDVLLKLGQVVGDVTLCEYSVLIILHLLGHVSVKVSILEVKHQILA